MNLLRVKVVLVLILLGYFSYSQKVGRLISLAPSITENIYLLGAENTLVGCTNYCSQALNDDVEQVGSSVDVNVEKILSLKPDLVLTMQLTKQQDLEALKKLGIKVVVIPSPVSFEEICQQTIEIGKLIGTWERAKNIISKTTQAVDSLKQFCFTNFKSNSFFFQIGANPVFTVLENTFMNDFITFCNGTNIATGMKKGTITRERILLKNPDVILIATMGGFGEQEKKNWIEYKGLNAVKNDKIFLIDSETSCSPTPENFVKAYADIVKSLNQDVE